MIEALVALLPIGTRKIFGHAGSPATEWNAIFVSLGDLLLLALVAAVFFRARSRREFFRDVDGPVITLFLFLAAVGLSVAWHGATGISVFWYAKLFLFAMFALAVRGAWHRKSRILTAVFLAVMLFESVLAVGQFFRQQDFGLRVLGESQLDSRAAGIAKIDVGRVKIVRAYGTLPHPNVLAAYTVSALLLAWRAMAGGALWWVAAVFPLVFALALTFSREALLAALVGFVGAAGIFFARSRAARSARDSTVAFFFAVALMAVISGIALRPFWTSRVVPSLVEPAVSERLFYGNAALSMIRQHPVAGVGWGNFADRLPEFVTPRPIAVPSVSFPLWLLQPVHNVYLLVVAEAGIPALAMFVLFLGTILAGAMRARGLHAIPVIGAFIAMLVIGFFDHFFLTTQQGALLFWFLAGIVMAQRHAGDKEVTRER